MSTDTPSKSAAPVRSRHYRGAFRKVRWQSAVSLTGLLPDLSGFHGPLEKARVMLEAAAEVEHMLLVQYLYAGMTLRPRNDPGLSQMQNNTVQSWRADLADIAVEEMGHLMTIQNLRIALGIEPMFEREEFPPSVPVYPFELHLSPLSRTMLARYVLAEAPLSEEDSLAEFREVAGAEAEVRHVGAIYGLLAVLFSSPETLPPADSPLAWDQFVRLIASEVGALADPAEWHLPENSVNGASVGRQADVTHFETSHVGFFFERVASTADARRAVQKVGLQGEAPVDATGNGRPSHYRRFRRMFVGDESTGLLPYRRLEDGGFVPHVDVDTDPRLAQYEGVARTKALEFDAAYAAMLSALAGYLSTDDAAARAELANQAIGSMFDLKQIAGALVKLPQTPTAVKRASPLFTMPF